jgi:hypothetical protein
MIADNPKLNMAIPIGNSLRSAAAMAEKSNSIPIRAKTMGAGFMATSENADIAFYIIREKIVIVRIAISTPLGPAQSTMPRATMPWQSRKFSASGAEPGEAALSRAWRQLLAAGAVCS